MILSREYQDKFNNLKQRFGCNDVELEALLRESNKSTTGSRSASIESLIDWQITQLDAPRGRRIYAVDWDFDEPTDRRGRKPIKEESGRLSNWEIREIFGTQRPFNPPIFRRLNKLANFRQSPSFSKRFESRRRLKNLRRFVDTLKREGRRELLREGRRVARSSIRRQVRGLMPRYF